MINKLFSSLFLNSQASDAYYVSNPSEMENFGDPIIPMESTYYHQNKGRTSHIQQKQSKKVVKSKAKKGKKPKPSWKP